ncbi:MAG: NfeD family protein [bacterium]
MPEISPTVIWAVVGLALIILEIFTTSFFLLFFGVAALLVSCVRLFGLDNLSIELLIFALLGGAGLLFFHRRLKEAFKASGKSISLDKEKDITVTEDIPAGQKGSIRHQGSPWKAINTSDVDLKEGDIAIIDSVDGITLNLKKK